MDWSRLLVVGLLAAAGLFAVYRSHRDDWETSRNVGTVLFFLGAAIGLVLDDFLARSSPFLPWMEPIGATVMLVGLFVSRGRSMPPR